MNNGVFYLLIVLMLSMGFSNYQVNKMEKKRLELSIKQHTLEIRYLTLQLELIDESAILTP